jgi:hypothetical protein
MGVARSWISATALTKAAALKREAELRESNRRTECSKVETLTIELDSVRRERDDAMSMHDWLRLQMQQLASDRSESESRRAVETQSLVQKLSEDKAWLAARCDEMQHVRLRHRSTMLHVAFPSAMDAGGSSVGQAGCFAGGMQQVEGAEKLKQEAEQNAEILAAVRRAYDEMQTKAKALELQANASIFGAGCCPCWPLCSLRSA